VDKWWITFLIPLPTHAGKQLLDGKFECLKVENPLPERCLVVSLKVIHKLSTTYPPKIDIKKSLYYKCIFNFWGRVIHQKPPHLLLFIYKYIFIKIIIGWP